MNISMAWRTTCASMIDGIRILLLLLLLAAVFVTAIAYRSSDAAGAAKVWLVMSSMTALFWWAFVSSRSLKIVRDADKLMFPAPVHAIAIALLLQATFTLLVPSLIYALLGNDFFHALAILIAVAAGGLLFMLLPRYLGIALTLSPGLFDKFIEYRLLPPSDSDAFFVVISLLALGMIVIAFWRFHALRKFEGDAGAWYTPMALMPDGANGWGAVNWSQSQDGSLISNGIRFDPAISRADTLAPSLALRTYLGAPFMPLTKRSQLKQFVLLSLIYLVLPFFMAFMVSKGSSDDIARRLAMAISWISLLGLGITFGAVLVRLKSLYSKDNAELAELALLPGWKNTRNARHLLVTVLAQHVGRALLLPAGIALLALLLMASQNSIVYFNIAALFLTATLIASGYGLKILSGEKNRAWLLGLVSLVLFLVSLIQLLLSVSSREYSHAWFDILAWIVFLSFALVYFCLSLRPFQKREHPFLRN